MAYPQKGSIPAKTSSYAKIAAMPAPNPGYNASIMRKDATFSSSSQSDLQHAVKTTEQDNYATSGPNVQDHDVQAAVDSIPVPLQKLALEDVPTDSTNSEPNADSADSYGEDQSQVSSSSLNKPHSFDTKSLTSVTTFAMDDKESIRPDDSASVRAADDENPHAALSRNSSFQHDGEVISNRSSRTFPPNVTIPGRRFPTLANPPRFGNLPISPVLECQDVLMPQPAVLTISHDEPRPPITIVSVPPDEKLMDALASAKDRLPLLQLEEKVLMFLANSSNDVLDLPPQNSFTRLLTHKLADYYSLPHSVNDDNTSVRIFRAGYRTSPPSLAQLAKSVPWGSAAAPGAAAFKIMRREQLNSRHFSAGNSTAPSSSVPSKTTSENGFEGPSDDGLTSPSESTPNRDKSKLTREEREAQYKAARERIFADFQESITSETTSYEEAPISVSRSSSSSEKKKTRRHKQPKDDSFEARSSFIQSYTPIQGQYSHAYADASTTTSFPVSPVAYDQNMYGATPTQTFASFDNSMQYANMQGSMQGFNPSTIPQFGINDWQAMQNMQMQNPYFMYQQALQFQQAGNMLMPSTQPMQNQIPDWYTSQNQQFMNPAYMSPMSPYPQNMPDQRSPVPNDQYSQQFQRNYSQQTNHNNYHTNSSNRSLFNPQTRSFVPTNNEGRGGNRGGRQKNQARHSLNSTGHTPSTASGSTSTTKEDSLKSRYGTPSSLPKKPPPAAEAKHSLQKSVPVLSPQQENVFSASESLQVTGVGKSAT